MADTYIDENGYRRFSDSGKLVSRWVAEKTLDRKLGSEEVVHHENRDKLDNDPDNLTVFEDQGEHEAEHEAVGDFDEEEDEDEDDEMEDDDEDGDDFEDDDS